MKEDKRRGELLLGWTNVSSCLEASTAEAAVPPVAPTNNKHKLQKKMKEEEEEEEDQERSYILSVASISRFLLFIHIDTVFIVVVVCEQLEVWEEQQCCVHVV